MLKELVDTEDGRRWKRIVTVPGGQYSMDERYTAQLAVVRCDGYVKE
jgi:hypothetical protein